MFDKFQVWVKMVKMGKMGKMVNMLKMGKMVNWSRWARWSDTLTTLSAHTRAKRRSSWSFGAFQQPEPSLWQLGWCDIALLVDRSTFHKDIALFLEIKMDDSVNEKKYNYRQQAQLQKS